MGCYAMQPADYDNFKPFFSKVLSAYYGVPEDAKHVNSWSLEGVEGVPADGVLDLGKLGLVVRTILSLQAIQSSSMKTSTRSWWMRTSCLRTWQQTVILHLQGSRLIGHMAEDAMYLRTKGSSYGV